MTDINTSGVEPLGFNLLVRMEPIPEKTKGGLYLPDDMKRREEIAETRGTVVAVSPAAFTFMEPMPENLPGVGDVVVFPRYSGFLLEGEMVDDGLSYRMIEDKSIAGRKPKPKAKRGCKAASKLEAAA